jgi:hypothetical protein
MEALLSHAYQGRPAGVVNRAGPTQAALALGVNLGVECSRISASQGAIEGWDVRQW